MAVTTTSVSIKDSGGTAQTFTTATDPAGNQRSTVALDERGAAMYSASSTFTPFATAAVTVMSVAGSATKTVRVKSITLSGHSTANAETTVLVQRTSALGSGGTAVTPTTAKLDGGTVAASTAVVKHYTTAAQSAGTAVGGAIRTTEFTTGVVTTPTITTPEVQIWPPPGAVQPPALVLRGASDFLELQNGNGGNLSAGTVLTYTVVWEEDGS